MRSAPVPQARTTVRARSAARQPRDDHQRGNTKLARDLARPLLSKWLKRVEAEVAAGKLIDFSVRLAKELTNYPSANVGYSFPSLERLGVKLNKCKRTLIYRLDDMVAAGLLKRERRGRRGTNSYVFCLDGKPLIAPEQAELYFGSDDPQPVGGVDASSAAAVEVQSIAPHEVQSVAPPEVQCVAPNLLERENIEREPPPNAPTEPHSERRREGGGFEFCFQDRQAPPSAADEPTPGPVLDGEILDRGISFNEFWEAGGNVGKPGPALVAWNKLSSADRCAIGDVVRRDGGLELSGMWACTWLGSRRWEHAPARDRSHFSFGEIAERLRAEAAARPPPPPPPPPRPPPDPALAAQRDRRQKIDQCKARLKDDNGYRAGPAWFDDDIRQEAAAELEAERVSQPPGSASLKS